MGTPPQSEEHDNLQAALRWMLHADPDAALRLAGTLGWFWFGAVTIAKGDSCGWTAALARSSGASAACTGQGVLGLPARCLSIRDRRPAHESCVSKAWRWHGKLGDERLIARALIGLGT